MEAVGFYQDLILKDEVKLLWLKLLDHRADWVVDEFLKWTHVFPSLRLLGLETVSVMVVKTTILENEKSFVEGFRHEQECLENTL